MTKNRNYNSNELTTASIQLWNADGFIGKITLVEARKMVDNMQAFVITEQAIQIN